MITVSSEGHCRYNFVPSGKPEKRGVSPSEFVTIRGLHHATSWLESWAMKTKPDKNTEADKSLRLAESKVKICEQVAAADQRQSHAAKLKFKNTKKAWKLARKKAKRSAKLAKLANKNLVTLAKHLKRMKRKVLPPKAAATSSPAKKPIRPTKPASIVAQSAPNKTAGVAAANPVGNPVVN